MTFAITGGRVPKMQVMFKELSKPVPITATLDPPDIWLEAGLIDSTLGLLKT